MPASERLPVFDFVRSAAFLRREFLGRDISDAESSTQRERTLYLFDTDVIVTYCQPWLSGPSSDHARGYGQIFPATGSESSSHLSSSERAAHIAAILAEYVFDKIRTRGLPAYQFDDHFEETRTIYEENARRFAGNVPERQITRTLAEEQRLRRAAALIANDRSPTEGRRKLLPMVEHLLSQMTPLGFPEDLDGQRTQAWERFLRLNVVTGGIYPVSLAADHFQRSDDPEVTEALRFFQSKPSGAEKIIFDGISSEIHKRLVDLGQPKSENSYRDAEAVARLYLINARLKHTRWQAVFVTGARTLTEACYGEFPKIDGVDPEIAKRFSQKFVRHLWAYTTEALLEHETDVHRKFINWLDGLLAHEAEATEFDENHLTSIVKGEINVPTGNRIVAQALGEWESLTEKAVSKHRFEALGLSSDEALRLQTRIVGKLARWREGRFSGNWQEITDELSEEYHRAKDRTFLEFSTIGKDTIFRTQGIGQRNPPDLAFGSLKNTNRIFRRLCETKPYTKKEFADDFEAIRKDCYDFKDDGDDRQLSHLRFLVLGATFAGANKWGVALSQGKRAVSIIERSQANRRFWPIKVKPPVSPGDPTSFMSGREAYFLCAAATRVIARTSREFDSAEALLVKAEEALRLDKKQGTAKKTNYVRFKSERLASAISRYYFERKKREQLAKDARATSGGQSTDLHKEYCDELVPSIYLAAKVLIAEIGKEEPAGRSYSDHEANLKRFGRVTLVHIATNLIQTCAIRGFRGLNARPDDAPFPVKRADLRQSLRLLQYFSAPPTECRSTDHLRETPLVLLYRDAGARILDEKEFSYKQSDEALRDLFNSIKTRDVAVYDAWRFTNLEDLGHKLNRMATSERHAIVFEQDT